MVVEGDDLTDPKVIGWMRDYQDELLTRHGYSAEEGCGKAALCPALSLPNLFRTPELSATREQVRALLDAVPPYFSQAAITPDRKTAVLAFGLRLQSLEGQRDVIEDMRARLRPAGRRARDGRRAAGAGRGRQPRDERSAAARADGAGRAARGGAGAVRRLPVVDAGVGAAGADRAGDGLVGARAVARGRAAEPDVGGAERAGDRDLDRVLGAAVGAVPRGAGGRLGAGRRRWRAPTARPAPPCSPPASRRSPASRC